MKTRYLLCAAALVSLALAACTKKEDAHIMDAMRFCEVFSPESLAALKAQYSDTEFSEELMRRVSQAVTTPEFAAILYKQHESIQGADTMYEYYVNEVSQLIGYKYSCPDLQAYFREKLDTTPSTTP